MTVALDERSGPVREWRTAATRGGRRFEPVAERQLHGALRDLAARLPGSAKGVSVIAEMPGPTGLPDLVAVPVTPCLADRLAFAHPPILGWGDARLIAACSAKRATSYSALARRTNGDMRSVVRRTRKLIDSGALSAATAGAVIRAPQLQPIGRIYALEAKVDDWSGGFGQALRYGSWADATAVVVAQLPRHHEQIVEQAANLGIGLAVGHRWLVRPRLRHIESARRLWASEFVVAALQKAELVVDPPAG